MDDALAYYEKGLDRLLEAVSQDSAGYGEFLAFEQRLRENIDQSRHYGDTEIRRAERAEVVDGLNRLAVEEVGRSFNKLCGFRGSGRRLNDCVNTLLIPIGLPPDMPLYERLGNLLMTRLGKVGERSVGVVMHLVALLILSVPFAYWLAQSDDGWTHQLWGSLGILWSGLILLPLMAGFLPQQREKDLEGKVEFTIRQQMALWLDKAFGAYVSAYLVEVGAIVGWLLLTYIGCWARMGIAGRTVFWLVVEWSAFVFSFVGAVIATKYWENVLKSGRQVNLEAQHFLLGLGFPLIVFPVFIVFALATSDFWKMWQTGGLAMGFGFLLLAWLLGRE